MKACTHIKCPERIGKKCNEKNPKIPKKDLRDAAMCANFMQGFKIEIWDLFFKIRNDGFKFIDGNLLDDIAMRLYDKYIKK